MNRIVRVTSLALTALAISTAAMAQQGGGNGGGGGSAGGGGGDNSIIELRLQDHERARKAAAASTRHARSCITYGCNEPQRPVYTVASESCGGGEYRVLRDRFGNIERIICDRRLR